MDMNRYSRQVMLSEIGEEGQLRLQSARVLVVGVGGLGSPIAIYLAAAGVGYLGLVDADVVSETNLPRQILYTEEDLGKLKVECAKSRLKKYNSNVKIDVYPYFLNEENGEEIVNRYDMVIDACDNMATRYLMNRLCGELRKPYVYGAIIPFGGQVSVFHYGNNGSSLDDIFPEDEFMSEEIARPVMGVVGATPCVIAGVQVGEVMKIVCGYGEVLSGKMFVVDMRGMETKVLEL